MQAAQIALNNLREPIPNQGETSEDTKQSSLEGILHGERVRVRFQEESQSHPDSWGFDSDHNVLTIPHPQGPVDADKYIGMYVQRAAMQYPKPRRMAAIVLHYHQPPGQEPYWIDKATEECYLPQSDWLASAVNFRGTVNLTSSLLQQLEQRRHYQVIDNFRKAVERGTIELTATGAKHPIMPVLSRFEHGDAEAKRQIRLSRDTVREYFGVDPKFFFPPELAFDEKIASILYDMGFKGVITDAPLFDSVYHWNPTIPHNRIGTVSGLNVFFRSNRESNELTLEMPKPERRDYDVAGYTKRLKKGLDTWFGADSGYVVLSFDGETFGHQVKQYANGLDTIARTAAQEDVGLQLVNFPQLQSRFRTEEVSINPGSWSTTEAHIAQGEYYPRWSHSRNDIHRVLGEMLGTAIGLYWFAEANVGKNPTARKALETSRVALDNGEQSDSFWWACKLEDKFNPRHIYTGADFLLGTARGTLDALERAGYNGNPVKANGFSGTIPEWRARLQYLRSTLDYFVEAASRS